MSQRMRQTQLSFLPAKRKSSQPGPELAGTVSATAPGEPPAHISTANPPDEGPPVDSPAAHALTDSPTEHFPIKFLLGVFSLLALRDVNRAAQVCRLWRSVGENNSFWKEALHRRYPRFPFPRMGKLRPMGLTRSLFNGVAASWHAPLPYAPSLHAHYGCYAWLLRCESRNSAQDRLKVLMGVSKPQLLVGVQWVDPSVALPLPSPSLSASLSSLPSRPPAGGGGSRENQPNLPRAMSCGQVRGPSLPSRGPSHPKSPWASTPSVCPSPAPRVAGGPSEGASGEHSFFHSHQNKKRGLASSCSVALCPTGCQEIVLVVDCTRGALAVFQPTALLAAQAGTKPAEMSQQAKEGKRKGTRGSGERFALGPPGWKSIPSSMLHPLPESPYRLCPFLSARSCALQVQVLGVDGMPTTLHLADAPPPSSFQ